MEYLRISKTFAKKKGKTEIFEGAKYVFSPIELTDGTFVCDVDAPKVMPKLFEGYIPKKITISESLIKKPTL